MTKQAVTAIILAIGVTNCATFGVGFLAGRGSKETIVKHEVSLPWMKPPTKLEAEIKETEIRLGSLISKLESFSLQLNRFPSSREGLAALNRDQWERALKDAGKEIDDEAHDMLLDHSASDADLRDAWGNPIQYACPRRGHKVSDSYDVWSMGPDGIDGTEDDISRWETGLFF